MMFGSKKTSPPPPEQGTPAISVEGMPQEFYGGANPVVSFKTVPKEVVFRPETPEVPVADKKAFEEQTAVGGGDPSHPIHWFSNPKKLALLSAGILGITIIGVTTYYLATARQNMTVPPLFTNTTSTATSTLADSTSTLPADTTPVATPSVTGNEQRLDTASLVLTDDRDNDADGLTDVEEELYRTDPEVKDTDRDTYPDGHEPFYLYSPTEREPGKLIESGSVREYSNPTFGYTLYYPSGWVVDTVDPQYRHVLFSTLRGEYVGIQVFDRSGSEPFEAWMARVATTERLSDYQNFMSRFNEPGVGRQDRLVYFYVSPTRIYALTLHNGTEAGRPLAYRQTFTVMARSFRTNDGAEAVNLTATLPEPEPRLPPLVIPTSTPEVTSSPEFAPGTFEAAASSTARVTTTEAGVTSTVTSTVLSTTTVTSTPTTSSPL